MIVTIGEVKEYLRIDTDEEDTTLQIIINAAEEFIKNAIGSDVDNTNERAKMVCFFLIADMYDQRGLSSEKGNSKIKDIAKMMLLQI